MSQSINYNDNQEVIMQGSTGRDGFGKRPECLYRTQETKPTLLCERARRNVARGHREQRRKERRAKSWQKED